MDSPEPVRLRGLFTFLTVLWAATALIICLFTMISLVGLLFGSGTFPFEVRLSGFFINAWALAGIVGLAFVRFSPTKWIEEHPNLSWLRRRWMLGSLSMGLVLGWFVVSWMPYVAIMPYPFLQWIVAFFSIIPIPQLIGGLLALFLLVATLGLLFQVFIGWPISMFTKIMYFDRMWAIYKHHSAGLSNYLIRFAYWLAGKELPAPPPDDTRGARFATWQETVDLINTGHQAKHGAAFGHIAGSPLLLNTEKHVLIMASTRSGKGVSLIIPHLLRYPGSAFVLDPKGENAKATGRRRSEINDKVHYLDPFGISGKPQARFNPLSRFTVENMEAESKALAGALVMGHQGDNKRDHWTTSAQQLLASVILYVFASPDFAPKEKDLPTVRRLLLGCIDDVLKDMAESDLAEGLIADLARSFLNTPDSERGSIISTAQRETEILDNPFIAACLSASGEGEEVDFAAWKTGTMTVYLCLSAPKFPVFSRWLRLVLTSALDEMTDTLNPPSLPVCFMLDELATLGHLTAVENAVGLAAGYGVQLFTVFQDVAQMKDLYRGRWASFIGNAGVRALFNLDDYETAKYWSDSIGGHIVQTMSQQQDIYGYSHGQNVGETMRPLLSPEEIMLQFAGKMKINGVPVEPEQMLILSQGSRPVIAERVPYFRDESLAGLWDDPRVLKQELPTPPPECIPYAGEGGGVDKSFLPA